jgi:serine/threonine protein kinase
LSIEEFEIIGKLGSGAFRDVVLAQRKDNGQTMAIKTMLNWNVAKRDYHDFVCEVSILRDSRHHSVLTLLGIIRPANAISKPAVVLPFMENDSVAKAVEHSKKMELDWWTSTMQYIVLYGTALGLAFLHSKKRNPSGY